MWRPSKKQFGLFFFFILMVVLCWGGFWFLQKIPLLSPITSSTTFRFLSGKQEIVKKGNKVVYGFLPYWNLDKVTIQPELTHLAYFSLTIGSDGSILTTIGGEGDPGFNRLRSDELLVLMEQVRAQHGKVEIVLSQMNNDDIANFLLNKNAQKKFFQSLDSILLAYSVEGINIDFEYVGEVPPQLRNNFASFMEELRSHLQAKYKHISLSVDIYPSGANNNQLWDVDRLATQVDYIVIMAYDFHRRSSPLAGPVAPLFGGKKFWDSDITQYLRMLLVRVPKSKILLGVPFYGYEWQTISADPQAQTFPDTGSTATLSRVQELLAQKDQLGVQEHWNDDALSPYLSYKQNRQTYLIYYENSRSLSYKLDLVNQLDLGGIAIWALGYEKNDRELWDVVQRKL